MFSRRDKPVEKPWTKARKLAFAHGFSTLIHPLPALRRGKAGGKLKTPAAQQQ
jgi:hypothetical protein